MAELSRLFDIDIVMEFHSIDCQLVKTTGILLLLTFVNNDDKKRLRELNRERNYESIVFCKNEFCLEFSEILKFFDSDRLYQHTLIMLVHFAQESKKDDFDSSDSLLLLN